MPEGELVPTPEESAEQRLRETERRRLESLVAGDLETASLLHADDYQLITPGGGCISKSEYLGGIESGLLDYHVFEAASEVAVKVYTDVAIIRYQARIELARPGYLDHGMFWHTDFYELRDARWQAVWSQATRIAV